MEAFSKVLKAVPDAELKIIGSHGKVPYEYIVGMSQDNPKVCELKRFYEDNRPDSYYLYCKNLCEGLSIDNKVKFLSGIPYEKMSEHYRNADVLVNASFSESLGRSLFEGMACGIPVIGTRVGGSPEIISEGQTGFIVDSGATEDLSKSIIKLLDNFELASDMGVAGRKRVQRLFSWETISENLMGHFIKLQAFTKQDSVAN